MPEQRATPFDLVFEPAAQTSFPAIRAAIQKSGHDPKNRDRFLLLREVLLLLRELRPDDGLGEGIDQLAALVHHAYLFWEAGQVVVEIPAERIEDLLSQPAELSEGDIPAEYVQLPERRIWAQVVPGHSQEPLDGLFHHSSIVSAEQRVLGVFGMYSDRPGFSVVEVAGRRSSTLIRPDGSSLFSSTLPGGTAAKLYSVAGEEELLELGWRVTGVGSQESDVGGGTPARSATRFQSGPLLTPDS